MKKESEAMLDTTRVEPIPQRPEEISKSVAFRKDLWGHFKAQTKKNGHTIKEALEFGIRAYLETYKVKKK